MKFTTHISDINECASGTHLCEHICYNNNGSYTCDCQQGYYLSNGLTCSDVNECNNNNGGCAQLCVNQVGSYYCQCNNGYTLDDDAHGCSGKKCWLNFKYYLICRSQWMCKWWSCLWTDMPQLKQFIHLFMLVRVQASW